MVLSEFQLGLRLLVKTYYGEPHRFYHTMNHVEAMLDAYHKYFGEPTEAEYIAIHYHDAVYIPWHTNNEESSIALMHMHAKLYFPSFNPEVLFKAAKIILDTKHTSDKVDEASKRVVDLDMMILGRSSEVYTKYVANTRKEYIKYTDAEWNEGRAKVLEGFLAMPRIFLTDIMHKEFESQARINIQDELNKLKEAK